MEEQSRRNAFIVAKTFHDVIVAVAAKHDNIFAAVEFVKAQQRFKIFTFVFVEVVAVKNQQIIFGGRELFQKPIEFIQCRVNVAETKHSAIGRIIYGRDNFFRVVDKKFFSHKISFADVQILAAPFQNL